MEPAVVEHVDHFFLLELDGLDGLEDHFLWLLDFRNAGHFKKKVIKKK